MSRALAEPRELADPELVAPEPVDSETAAASHDRDSLVADLVRRALLGDQAAWEALIEQFNTLLWWTARRAGLTENDGADAVQLTWLRCVEHLSGIRDPARLPAWLITTCRRESLRIRQLAIRFPPTDCFAPASVMAMSSTQHEDDPAAEKVIAAERKAVVREAIAHLPDRQRKLLSALMEDDTRASYANAAASLQIPISSIGPTRSRALRRLRQDPRLAQVR